MVDETDEMVDETDEMVDETEEEEEETNEMVDEMVDETEEGSDEKVEIGNEKKEMKEKSDEMKIKERRDIDLLTTIEDIDQNIMISSPPSSPLMMVDSSIINQVLLIKMKGREIYVDQFYFHLIIFHFSSTISLTINMLINSIF